MHLAPQQHLVLAARIYTGLGLTSAFATLIASPVPGSALHGVALVAAAFSAGAAAAWQRPDQPLVAHYKLPGLHPRVIGGPLPLRIFHPHHRTQRLLKHRCWSLRRGTFEAKARTGQRAACLGLFHPHLHRR